MRIVFLMAATTVMLGWTGIKVPEVTDLAFSEGKSSGRRLLKACAARLPPAQSAEQSHLLLIRNGLAA